MGTNVHLTPELERFAKECVADGRYNNVSEVVRDALRLLQDAAERKRKFMAMIHEVEAEVERDGTVSVDQKPSSGSTRSSRRPTRGGGRGNSGSRQALAARGRRSRRCGQMDRREQSASAAQRLRRMPS